MPDVSRLFAKSVTLPPMPEVAISLIRMLARQDVSVAEVSSLVERDSTLAARVLYLANAENILRDLDSPFPIENLTPKAALLTRHEQVFRRRT